MGFQTDYSIQPPAGLVGGRVDFGVVDVVTKAAEVAIPLARIVVKGASDGTVKLPTVTGGIVLGLSVLGDNIMNENDVNDYAIYAPVAVARKGRFYVKSETNVSLGDPVYFRHTANGGNTLLGKLRNAADGVTADLLAGAKFMTSGVAGDLVVLELNI